MRQWKKHKEEIMKLKTSFPISFYAQLYINGDQQVFAKYPNIDSTASHYNSYVADAIDPDRIAKCEHPKGAIVLALRSGEWCGLEEGDVIIHCEEITINHITDLLSTVQGNNWKGQLNLIVIRNQVEKTISLKTK